MRPYIVADIGGTNARFALVTGKVGNKYKLENIEIFNGAEFDSFDVALSSYISGLKSSQTNSGSDTNIMTPKAACIAIAGPIDGDNVKMTNLDWMFSQAAIKEHFNFDLFAVINDFGALSVATSRLIKEDVDVIKSGEMSEFGNKVILGPGTGLGVAGLVYSGEKWVPVPSEGGHVNIAPATRLECDVVKAGMSQHDYVSAETFISGQGLINIYEALCMVKGVESKSYLPKDITANAVDNTLTSYDENCYETLSLFCSFIGSTAANLALSYGARGGVYLGGGILPRISDFLKSSQFAQRFSQKGVMSHYVEPIPVNMIAYKQTAFLGAAAWLEQLLNTPVDNSFDSLNTPDTSSCSNDLSHGLAD